MSKSTLEPFDMLIRVSYQPHKEFYGYNVAGEGTARIGDSQIPIKVYVGLSYTDARYVTTCFGIEVRADDLSAHIKRANGRESVPQLEEPKNEP